MDQQLVAKYKLDEIHALEGEDCLEALQFLNYLLVRTDDETEKAEIRSYIERANQRCKELNLLK